MLQRLDKLLANHTTLSRRDAAARIRVGRVTVDGVPVRDPSRKVDETVCALALDGQAVTYRRNIYIMLNKPAGILCVSRDPHAPTVVDLLDETERCRGLFPAGRLDKDTTGMVLLTDDGDFAHRMLAPKKHVDKQYLVTLDAAVNEDTCRAFATGMTLGNGEVCREAICEILPDSQALVTLREGKYHQIKRMFAACGYHVEALHRLSMGGLALDPALGPGEYKILSETEAMTVFL